MSAALLGMVRRDLRRLRLGWPAQKTEKRQQHWHEMMERLLSQAAPLAPCEILWENGVLLVLLQELREELQRLGAEHLVGLERV